MHHSTLLEHIESTWVIWNCQYLTWKIINRNCMQFNLVLTVGPGTVSFIKWWLIRGLSGRVESIVGPYQVSMYWSPRVNHWHMGLWNGNSTTANSHHSFDIKLLSGEASLVAQTVKNLPAMRDPGSIPGLGRSPGEGNGINSSILVWRIPMDRGGWQATSAESQRVGHDWVTFSFTTLRWHALCWAVRMQMEWKNRTLQSLYFSSGQWVSKEVQ